MSALHNQVQAVFATDPVTIKRLAIRCKQAAPGINKAQANAIAESFLKSEIVAEMLAKTVAVAQEVGD